MKIWLTSFGDCYENKAKDSKRISILYRMTNQFYLYISRIDISVQSS